MFLGTRIAKKEFMTHKTPQSRLKSSPRVQQIVTFAILSLALVFASISQAETLELQRAVIGETKLKQHTQESAKDILSSRLRTQLSLEKKVDQQIKLDLDGQKSIGINGLRALGGDSSGGGNPEEVKFIATAVQIRNWLNLAPEFVKTQFGFGTDVLTQAIGKTQVSCAAEPYLSYIRNKGKKAFFIQPLKTVFLDCEKLAPSIADTEAFRGLVFHEYMRSAGIEGEDVYKYSSQINWVVISAYEISNSPVHGNYAEGELGETAAVYYRGRIPIYRGGSWYGDRFYLYDVELTKQSDGIWIGEGNITQEGRVMPCYYQVRVKYQILYGYEKPVAYVQVTLPVALSNSLDRNEQTGKLTCPVPPMKIKTLTLQRQN